MINFIKGIADELSENFVVIDNNGIGYGINVSLSTLQNIKKGTEVKLYTIMTVREDDISLYGFINKEELKLFNQLIGVNGVGPKNALSLLSAMSPTKLALAIMTEDINTITLGQGIGKKIAQRIALELKDKIGNEQALADSSVIEIASVGGDSTAKSEAIDGLMALGFSKNEATQAVNAVYTNDTDSSKLISKALRVLS